jgi:uncharacterized membrane protein YqjE
MAETNGSTAADFSSTAPASEASTSELVTRLTQQSTELIRSELRLAQAEMTEKAKHAGVGAGLFGGAATLILVLATFLAPWLAALIVTVVLFAIAGIVALMGKKQISEATPAAPKHTIENVKQDVDTIKGGAKS